MKHTGKLLIGAVLVGGMMFTKSFVSAEMGHDGQGGHRMEKSKSESRKNVTIKGEVIDVTCYVAMDGKGEKHKPCGLKCLEKGLPVGIAEAKTGKIYLVVNKNHEPANEELGKYVASQVAVTGDVHEGHGLTLLLMTKMEKKP